MKIKNISSQTISIPFKQKGKKSSIVNLPPNHIVYCQRNEVKNNRIIILGRKNKIEITEDELPQNGKYYHPYGVMPHSEIEKQKLQPVNPVLTVEDDDDDDESLNDDGNILEEITDDETLDKLTGETSQALSKETPQKNKGGRPKGSKNKPKRGRPKAKKPRGRPRKNKK